MTGENQSPPTNPGFFQRLIAPHPSVQEIGARRQAQLLATFSLVVSVFLIIGLAAGAAMGPTAVKGILALGGLTAAALLAYLFSRTRFFLVGSLIITVGLAASGFWLILNGEDPQRSLISTVPLALIVGSVLLPSWGMAALSIAVVAATSCLVIITPSMELRTVIVDAGSFLTIGVAFLAANAFRNSIEHQRLDEVRKINQDLQSLQASLEKGVEERTTTLEQRNYILQTISDFARLASQAHEETELLEQSVQMIAGRLRLEHVSLFLMDEQGENAILCAAYSQAGKAQLADRYQLKVASGELAYIFPEGNLLRFTFGRRAYRMSPPAILPGATTNISFPLVTGLRLLGILNIQTSGPTPPTLEKDTLQTFADQIALSLQNIRLLAQLQSRINEISLLAGRSVKSSWDRIRHGGTLGYLYDQLHVLPSSETFPKEITKQLLAGQTTAYTSLQENPRSRLVTPIILRDEVIGVIGYEDPEAGHVWQAEEKALLETIAARVSLALENTRLVDEAQRRAEQERTLGQLSTRMRASLDLDTVLQTAVKEMRKSLNLEQAEVRLQLAPMKSEVKRRPRKESEEKVELPDPSGNPPPEVEGPDRTKVPGEEGYGS